MFEKILDFLNPFNETSLEDLSFEETLLMGAIPEECDNEESDDD